MKKLIALVSFLMIVVTATTAAAEENAFFGIWLAPWDDGLATIKIEDTDRLIPGTVIVEYSWNNRKDGVCIQSRIHGETISLVLREETVIILRVSDNGLVGERYSKTRLQKIQNGTKEER